MGRFNGMPPSNSEASRQVGGFCVHRPSTLFASLLLAWRLLLQVLRLQPRPDDARPQTCRPKPKSLAVKMEFLSALHQRHREHGNEIPW